MEAEERPKAFEELGKQIQKYMKILEAYKAKVRTYLAEWGWVYGAEPFLVAMCIIY